LDKLIMNNDQQLAVLEKDLKDVEKKLDDHIKIYVDNGKEIAKNNELLAEHIKMNKEQWKKIEPALDSFKQQEKDWEYIRPMVKDYETIVNGGRIVRSVAYFILAVGTITALFYKFIK